MSSKESSNVTDGWWEIELTYKGGDKTKYFLKRQFYGQVKGYAEDLMAEDSEILSYHIRETRK